jgi:hypothetical protein
MPRNRTVRTRQKTGTGQPGKDSWDWWDCTRLPTVSVLSWLSCPGWPSRPTCLPPDLSPLSCPHYAAVFSRSGRRVTVVLSQLHCPSCHSLASCPLASVGPTWPVDLSRLSCPSYPVIALLSWMWCHSCPVSIVRSQVTGRTVVSLLPLLSCHIGKGGHPQFKSATSQYCGLPNRLRSCGLKKVAELRLRTLKSDFRNSATFSSLLLVPLLSSPFSSAHDGFKNQPKIFLELSVSLENKNLP